MMEMDDNKLISFLKNELDKEADLIMKKVEADPDTKDVVAPEGMRDKIYQQISEHEKAKAKAKARRAKEKEELMGLGKRYTKKRGRRKYYVLVFAIVGLLGFSMTSLGDAKKVIREVKGMIAGREQINIDKDGERTAEIKTVKEEEAYDKIKEEFGFYPVRMFYLPDNMNFVEAAIVKDLQNVRLYYEDDKGRVLSYRVVTDYRDSSIGAEIEDELVREYEKTKDETTIKFQEYCVKENGTSRWSISFAYKNAHYSIIMTETEQVEIEKIVENLYFS